MGRRALVAGFACAAVVVASCTIFDGLDDKVTGADGGTEAGGGDASLLPGQQAGFLSLSDGVLFCSNAFSCPNLPISTEFAVDVPVDSNRFSSCIDWVSGPLPKDRNGATETAALLQCAARATTCIDADGCMWSDVIDSSDPRCNGKDAGKLGSCGDDGGSVYFCNQNAEIVHCDNAEFAAGSTCMYDDAGAPWCTRLPCGSEQCIGDKLDYCGTDGLQYSQNCALGGFTCGLDSQEGFDDCLTNGAAKKCSTLGVACAGTTVTLCDSILESHYDCGSYGGTCDATNFPRCALPNESCTPFDPDVDVCSGNTIALCVGGTKVPFDCTSVGKTCVAGSSGQSSHCQ